MSQTFAARTYSRELAAALTADLPAGLADIRPPHQPARAPAPAMSKVIAGAALVIPPEPCCRPRSSPAMTKWAKMCLTLMFFDFIAWMIAGTVMLDSWLPKRPRGQPPPPSAPRGPALEGEQDGGSGDDRILCRYAAVPVPVTCPVTGHPAPGGA